MLDEPPAPENEFIEGFGLDKLTPERLKQFQQLLSMLEKLKS
ncbi:hypothetical protein OBA47_01810 [bacterium]|nr:hypothetical protein [bacterium]